MKVGTTTPPERGTASGRHAAPSLADDITRRLRDHVGIPGGLEVTLAALKILDQVRIEVGWDTFAGRGSAPWWEEPPPILLCDEFLAPSELRELRRYVLSRKDAFSAASLVNGESRLHYVNRDVRVAETLFDLGPFRALLEARVSRYLDFVCARLDLPGFARPTFELQFTATRSGGYFRAHDDNSHPGNKTRRLTFVYYFFLQPVSWTGGTLRFSQSTRRSEPLDVAPVENRMVFFDPSKRHEIMPFVSGSDTFEAARFTVNGWVHQNTWP